MLIKRGRKQTFILKVPTGTPVYCFSSLNAECKKKKNHTGEWEEDNLETPRSETPSRCRPNWPGGWRLWTQAEGGYTHRVVMNHSGLNPPQPSAP